MTDDESRKAFEEYYLSQSDLEAPLERSDDGYKYFVGNAVWRDWQAAVEWATKRERERCAKMLEEMVVYEDLNVQESLRGLLEALQELKP